MKRVLICLALILLLTSVSEAGFLRRGRRGGCKGGQCGNGQAAPAAPALPARTTGFSSLDAINGTARQCDRNGGCDR